MCVNQVSKKDPKNHSQLERVQNESGAALREAGRRRRISRYDPNAKPWGPREEPRRRFFKIKPFGEFGSVSNSHGAFSRNPHEVVAACRPQHGQIRYRPLQAATGEPESLAASEDRLSWLD